MPQDATSNAVRDTKGLSGAASFHTLNNPTNINLKDTLSLYCQPLVKSDSSCQNFRRRTFFLDFMLCISSSRDDGSPISSNG